MPPSVAAALTEYFLEHPAVEVELPWGGLEDDRERKKFPLILTTTYGNALRADIFDVEVWKPAPAAAGVIPVRNVILEAGESVVTLARWLGHSTPTITLDFYAHFMPEAGGEGRGAIDALLNRSVRAVTAG
ncbi:hypothetical protein ACFV23_07845 [Streptomyces sp. NPDC059627]